MDNKSEHKTLYVCGKCHAVTDYPEAFCRKCYMKQFFLYGFIIILVILLTALVQVLLKYIGITLGAIPMILLAAPMVLFIGHVHRKFKNITPATVDNSENCSNDNMHIASCVDNSSVPPDPSSDKLAEKKRELHDLEVDIVKLRNAKARRAALAAQIKKQERIQRWGKFSHLMIVFGILSVIFLAASITFGVLYAQSQQALSEANASVAELKEEVEVKNSLWEGAIKDYNKLNNKYVELNNDYNKAHDCQVFLNQYIGIIVDGSQYYHRYGCEDIEGKPFWAYNVEQFKAMGYKPCPKCHSLFFGIN